MAACRSLLKTGSRSFHAASRFLPYHCRDSATALYAFCRQADDAVDDSGAPHLALEMLHGRLDALYRGAPEDYAADRALASVVVRCGLPRGLLDALLDGFAWDAEGREYETLSEVLDYAARVAGSVGVMMAVIMGIRDASVLARAADMGVAMQLTNISRDVGEDARNGRVYLPGTWLREAGVDPDALRVSPQHSNGLASVTRRMLVVADKLYRRADAGLTRLPLRCRPGHVRGTAVVLHYRGRGAAPGIRQCQPAGRGFGAAQAMASGASARAFLAERRRGIGARVTRKSISGRGCQRASGSPGQYSGRSGRQSCLDAGAAPGPGTPRPAILNYPGPPRTAFVFLGIRKGSSVCTQRCRKRVRDRLS